MASGLFVLTFRDILDASQLPVDLISDTIRGAMFTGSLTPDYNADTAYAVSPYNANEVSDSLASYTAGGQTLTTKTLTGSGGNLTFDAADMSWASSTISNAQYLLVYDDTVATGTANPGLCTIDFGQQYSTSNGTFTVQFSASGIWYLDLA